MGEISAGVVIVWTYVVKAEYARQFEETYGDNGKWAQLFRHSDEYLNTVFCQDVNHPYRYSTFDYWTTAEAFKAFREKWQAEYFALDQFCAGWTLEENYVGTFRLV